MRKQRVRLVGQTMNENEMVVVYLASPRAAGWRCWTRLDCLSASLKLLRLHAPPWPVVVFHEDYEEEDKQRLRAIAGENISFEKIDFTGLEASHINRRPDNRVGTYGYCIMCRFFAGQLQKHPAVQAYSHYMRLDDDSYLLNPVSLANVEKMKTADYTYRSVYHEDYKPAWNFALEFMKKEGLTAPQRAYDGASPYNNFHVSSLALWCQPLVQRFVESIDKENMFTRNGWTDTAVHSAILYLLGPTLGLKVCSNCDFMYRHNQHCVHSEPHNQYCKDRFGGEYNWGPPACLEQQA